MKICISNDKIFLASLYDNIDENKVRTVGVYHLVLDIKTMKLVTQSKKDYSISFLTTNYADGIKEREAKIFSDRKNSDMGDLRIVDIQVNNRGDLIILSEIYYLTSPSNSDHVTTNALDLILTKFSEEGDHVWSNIYKKRQQAVNPKFMGSLMMIKENQAALFFNDNVANGGRYGIGQLQNYTLKENACVGAIIVNLENGDYTKELLQISENEGSNMQPGAAANDEENGMPLYLTNRDKASFMRVQFQ